MKTINTKENQITLHTKDTIIEEDIVVNFEGGSGGGTDTSDATATADDILLDKTAYVNGEKIIGTIMEYDGSVENGVEIPDMLQQRVDATNSCQNLFNGYGGSSVDYIKNLDTSRVQNFEYMFIGCGSLLTIPLIDTSNGTRMQHMFNTCMQLQYIPQLNTSKVTDMNTMFSNCRALTTIPQLNTSNVTSMGNMFSNCLVLKSILMYGMKVAFDISSSTQFEASDLVTTMSNCQVVTTSRKLTMGSTNLAKLNNVYVKETGVEPYEGITVRPCVICESTDTGAMLATDYFTSTGWTLA
ncbi:MAG: BspA family leucine-rich repeat surface protein [Bacilli bacterium]|nr:BspA family leucine-rich repeat surface protein [Bacilli bacterium]